MLLGKPLVPLEESLSEKPEESEVAAGLYRLVARRASLF